MALEIELKAHVDDPLGLRALLTARFEKSGTYVKEDVYFRLPNGAEFRLRREGPNAVVTAKEKSREGGVETNVEHEFAVSDPEAFRRFARALGAEVFSRKRKTGERFSAAGAVIELSEVHRLGWFVEIERLVEEGNAAAAADAQHAVRRLLHEIGIGDDRIEERYYTDMLAELGPETGST